MARKYKEEVKVLLVQGLDRAPDLIKQLVPGTLVRATFNEQLVAWVVT